MTLRIGLAVGLAALALGAGCAPRAKINSAHVAENGTHLVSSPGALSVVRQSSSSTKVCTLRATGGHRMKGKKGRGAGPGPGAGQGPAAMLDVLFFRLCEARANNDISAEQYASSVQMILETMSEMAARRPPPGASMRRGGPGMGGAGPGRFGPGMGRPGRAGRGFGPWGGRVIDQPDDEAGPASKGEPKGKGKGKGK